MSVYWYHLIAIISEVITSCFLKATQGFTKPLLNTIVPTAHRAAFYCLSVIIKTLPVSVVYAIWTGCGVALVTLLSAVILKQSIVSATRIVSITFIVTGVTVIQLFPTLSGAY